MLQLFTSTHNAFQQRKSAIITKRMLAGRSDCINYDHGAPPRLLWGPAGNIILRQVLPLGELRRLLGAFIYKQLKCSVQGEVPAHRMALPATTFNHSPSRVAITQVLLKNKFETLCYSSLLAHTMVSNKGNLQSSLNACWQAGQITFIITMVVLSYSGAQR